MRKKPLLCDQEIIFFLDLENSSIELLQFFSCCCCSEFNPFNVLFPSCGSVCHGCSETVHLRLLKITLYSCADPDFFFLIEAFFGSESRPRLRFQLLFYVQYSTLLHLPPLRFHCVGGCWDRTQDYGIGCQTL